MRFLNIVHSESSCGWGGQELRILSEAAALSEVGHQVQIICPYEAPLYSEAQALGLQVTALPIRKKSFTSLMAVREFLKYNQLDVVNTHSSTDSWLVSLASKLVALPPAIVRTRHVSAAVEPNWQTRWLYRQAKFIVTTGVGIRQHLIDTLQLPEQRVISVPTAINSDKFSPPTTAQRFQARQHLELDDQHIHIVIVATLRSWKGHEDLLHAISQLANYKIKLSIIGDGPQYERLSAMIQVLRLGEIVQLVGHQDDVIPWLHAADIFVLPSFANEGVPQSLMQAMLCQIACISTDIGGIPEVALDHQTALVVSPRQPDEIAAALRTLINEPNLRQTLANNANKLVTEKFAYPAMIAKMEEIFFKAIEGK